MKVRSLILAVALSCGLATLAQAKAKPTTVGVANKKAAAAARKNARKQVKHHTAMARKAPKVRRAVKRPAKH